jgi:hypothetical protein
MENEIIMIMIMITIMIMSFLILLPRSLGLIRLRAEGLVAEEYPNNVMKYWFGECQ